MQRVELEADLFANLWPKLIFSPLHAINLSISSQLLFFKSDGYVDGRIEYTNINAHHCYCLLVSGTNLRIKHRKKIKWKRIMYCTFLIYFYDIDLYKSPKTSIYIVLHYNQKIKKWNLSPKKKKWYYESRKERVEY